MSYRILVVFLTTLLFEELIACEGYDIKLLSIKNCGDANQVVKIYQNSTTIINDKCEVFSNTCASVKSYNKAMAVVTMRRNDMVIFNGTENLCQNNKKRNELALVMMSVCGLRCSMNETFFCDNGSKVTTFSASKKLFGVFSGGSLKTRVEVKHNTGTSCFESDLSIQRQ